MGFAQPECKDVAHVPCLRRGLFLKFAPPTITNFHHEKVPAYLCRCGVPSCRLHIRVTHCHRNSPGSRRSRCREAIHDAPGEIRERWNCQCVRGVSNGSGRYGQSREGIKKTGRENRCERHNFGKLREYCWQADGYHGWHRSGRDDDRWRNVFERPSYFCPLIRRQRIEICFSYSWRSLHG